MKERAEEILAEIIAGELAKPSKWRGSRFGGVKQIPSTNVGDVAERFAAALFREIGCDDAEQKSNRRGEWDIRVGGKTLEVKGASEDTHGNFQFNGLSYRPKYDLLLVVGIAPEDVLFRFYRRTELLDLPLVQMSKGSSGSYKLTRRRADLLPIADFPAEARKFVGGSGTSPE